MKKLALIGLILLLMATAVTFTPSGGGFDLSWSTIDSGGGTSSGGGFVLTRLHSTFIAPPMILLRPGATYPIVGSISINLNGDDI